MRLRGGGITRSITVRRIASRRRRRADVQDQQPAHREDRGRPPRRRPARPAVLPARPRRQGRDPARAPHQRLTTGAAPAATPAATARPRRIRRGRSIPVGYAVDGSDRPDPPPRAPPLERGARAGRRRRRGRRRPDLRRRRRRGRDHAARAATGSRASATPRRCPPRQRERLAPLIRRRAVAVGVGAASVREIDQLNIYHATHLAMRRAIARVGGHDHVLVDGNRIAGSRPQSGRTPTSSTATPRSTRSRAPRSWPRSSATG